MDTWTHDSPRRLTKPTITADGVMPAAPLQGARAAADQAAAMNLDRSSL